MLLVCTSMLIFLAFWALAARQASAAVPLVSVQPTPAPESVYRVIMDASPNYPYDPNTVANCSWWWDHDGTIACEDMPRIWGITPEEFLKWNPSITPDCGNFTVGQSYCVETPEDSDGLPSSSAASSNPTSTNGSSGISTPTPTQPSIVDNCAKFYFVQQGDTCDSVAKNNGITTQQVNEWNPSVGSGCTGLWANAYACVGLLSDSGTSSINTGRPTSTTTGNGITTPTPTQPEMISNCNKFYKVKKGEVCASIAQRNDITEVQFQQWNPSVGEACTGLWADAYVCVGRGRPPSQIIE